MSATAVVFVVCVAVCIIAHAAILLSSISARAVTDVSAAAPLVPRPRAVSEFLWALVPIFALALVLTATWARVRDQDRPHPPALMKVAQ